jgi:peptidoglycan/xylan/chitin deacetylase (PgdA/CDA1 family)
MMKTSDIFSMHARCVAGSVSVGARRLVACTALQGLKVLLVGALSAVTLIHSAEAASARTIVSLTFDDGLTQSPVRDILRSHGMKGTFYVNANLIGSGVGYLTKAELDTLVADGNEIGGHTTNHVDLSTLSDADQKTAICGDLQTLNTWYPNQIRAFAYPFASTGPTTQSILAAGCPGDLKYSNARTVGGLVSGSQCTGCATAESIPPGNPYYIQTPESILSTTTLDQIKTLVTQAENSGGGWVPLVFHSVCTGCSSYGVTAATLDAFLTWLQARESNFTYVRTVNQVMTGNLPAPPPPPPLSANLLTNPSLELDADVNNQADCWQRAGYGTNTATWTRTTDAPHAGSFAERVQITAYSSGDQKLVQALDAGQSNGGCAPTVEATAAYQLGVWYKSTASVIPVLFYRSSSGVWTYWRDGPLLPASASWAQMTYSPGPVPAGAQAISFGIALDSVGTLSTDDYSMQKVLDSSDTTAPAVSITAPANATTLSGAAVAVTANASDSIGVVGVQFRLDGANLGTEDTTAPYSISWNTTTTANGSHSLTALARDAAGNNTISSAVAVTVSNADTTAPVVALTTPAAGAMVSGTATLTASASDNVGVVGVQFRLDGANLGTEDTTAPYSIAWNTATAANGSHTLSAVARDAAGHTTTSANLSVSVNNLATNTAPVANGDIYLFVANVTRTVSAPGVLGNDTDAQGSPLTAQLVAGSLVNGGTLSCASAASPSICANGSFSYFRATGTISMSFRYRASDGALSSAPATGATTSLRINTVPTTVADNCSYDRSANTVTQPTRCTVTVTRAVLMKVLANDYDRNHPASPNTLNNPTDGIGQTVVAATMRITAVGSGVNVTANAACGQAAMGTAPGSAATITNHCDGTLTVTMTASNTRNIVYSYQVSDDLGAQSSARQVTLSSVP